MFLQPSRTRSGGADVAGSPPNSWFRIAVGFVSLGAAAALCVAVFQYELRARPVNLRARTLELAGVAEEVLAGAGVPAEDLTRGEPRIQNDSQASWYLSSIGAKLPETASWVDLMSLLRRTLLAHGVTATEASTGNLIHQVSLSLGVQVFLEMRIEETFVRPDLSAACAEVAGNIRALLETQGVAPEAIQQTAPETKEDPRTVWTYTRMAAPQPAGKSIEEFEGLLQKNAGVKGVRVTTQIGLRGTTTLTVLLQGVPCVGVVLERGDLPAAEDDLQSRGLNGLHGAPGIPANGITLPNLEDLPLDSMDLDEMDQGTKLTGIGPPKDITPKVAIIVDDGGYGGSITRDILALSAGLTLAILPNTPAAGNTAERAAELGFEVMLHMPMERADVPGRVLTGMSRDEMRGKFENALAQIPGAAGVNNHMGSIFTSNEAAMANFLNVLQEHPLFFIDSRTTAKSRAFERARALGIRTASRDVFLDNRKDPNYIIGQFNHLMNVAKEQGRAIGICHFRPTTAQVLAQMLPQLEKNGIKLVHASELVQ